MLIKALCTDGVSADEGLGVGLGEVLQAREAGESRFDWLEASFHLLVKGLHGTRDL